MSRASGVEARRARRAEQETREDEEAEAAGLNEVMAPAPISPPARDQSDMETAETFEDPQDIYGMSGLSEGMAPPMWPLQAQRQESGPSLEEEETKAAHETHRRRASLANMGYTIAWLILFSFYGALARIGLDVLNAYPNAPVFAAIWPQVVGCAVIGFFLQDRANLIRQHKALPIYIGVATGFCGSITTFSSWMLDSYTAAANSPETTHPLTKPVARDRGYNVLALFSQIVVTLLMAFAAVRFGARIALAYQRSGVQDTAERADKVRKYTAIADPLAIFLAILHWVGIILATAFMPAHRGTVLFSVTFAPLGTLLRWRLAILLNTRLPSFPLGTFAANTLGSLILAICVLLMTRADVTRLQCQVLNGISVGFCGCLTTLSTFMVEVDTLRSKHSAVYAAASIIVGFVIFILVTGVDHWVNGGTICSYK